MTITHISSPPSVITHEEATQLHEKSSFSASSGDNEVNVPDIVRYTQHNVRCLVTPYPGGGSGYIFGKGSLQVTVSKLYFYSKEAKAGIAIDYPDIILHAISRQPEPEGSGPCIYTQLGELTRLDHLGIGAAANILENITLVETPTGAVHQPQPAGIDEGKFQDADEDEKMIH
ncbi:8111_t:CDS:2 [Ambispora gerdemannii]|uniref:8111_t:CDS:1 n=1 Tax=Ambispora gerdemannii TaxID=144530 RepID=A0A9N8V1G2_9GLOM|nr:8111_t:CDS:2 [Ambispora gerdemannii]